MRWGAIVGLLAVVATGRMAFAQERGAESAEELQRVCEGAMDDLLHGKFDRLAGLDTLYKAGSDAGLRALAAQFRRNYESNQPGWGEPLDWKYLAATEIATGLRQYAYVCRYAQSPVFWSFTAMEENGRWFLLYAGCNSSNGVLANMPFNRPRQQDYLPICRKIVEMLARGNSEAGETIKQKLTERGPLVDLRYDRLTAQAVAASREAGKLLRCEPILTKDVADVMAECCFALQFEEKWLFFRFQLYRPSDEWKLMGLGAGENPQAALADFPIMPDGEASPVLTARSTDEDKTEKAETPLR